MVLKIFWFCLTLSVLEKLKNSIFEISIIPQTLNITNYRTPSAKPINLDIIRKFIEFSLKSNCVKAMFSLTVFGILLFKGRSVLWSVQLVTGCKRVQFSLRNQKWLPYKLRSFWMVFKNLLILFNPFNDGKTEKLDFWVSNNSTNFKHQAGLKKFFVWRHPTDSFLELPT